MTGAHYSRQEDAIIRDLAGKVPAQAIAEQLDRPKNGIHHRINKLGLDGRLNGEAHWNARMNNLQAAMISTLKDAGFTVEEIRRAWGTDVATQTLRDVCAGRSFRRSMRDIG